MGNVFGRAKADINMLEVLPNEILVMIFRLLKPQDKQKIGLVCKLFYWVMNGAPYIEIQRRINNFKHLTLISCKDKASYRAVRFVYGKFVEKHIDSYHSNTRKTLPKGQLKQLYKILNTGIELTPWLLNKTKISSVCHNIVIQTLKAFDCSDGELQKLNLTNILNVRVKGNTLLMNHINKGNIRNIRYLLDFIRNKYLKYATNLQYENDEGINVWYMFARNPWLVQQLNNDLILFPEVKEKLQLMRKFFKNGRKLGLLNINDDPIDNIARWLLRKEFPKQANLPYLDVEYQTPLHYAIINSDIVLTKKLLSEGADIHVVDKYGLNPLNYLDIQKMHNVGILEAIIESRLKSIQKSDGKKLIYMAALHGQFKIVKLLLEKDIDINVHDKLHGYSLLHFAVSGGYLEIVQFLLSNGIDYNIRNNDNETALDVAKRLKRVDMVNELTIAMNNKSHWTSGMSKKLSSAFDEIEKIQNIR